MDFKLISSADVETVYKYFDGVFLNYLKYPLGCYIDELKAISSCLEALGLLPDNVCLFDVRDCLYEVQGII